MRTYPLVTALLIALVSCSMGEKQSFFSESRVLEDFEAKITLWKIINLSQEIKTYIDGEVLITCQSCKTNKLYNLTTLKLCSGKLKTSLALQSNSIASVLPSFRATSSNGSYNVEITWVFDTQHPISADSLFLCS